MKTLEISYLVVRRWATEPYKKSAFFVQKNTPPKKLHLTHKSLNRTIKTDYDLLLAITVLIVRQLINKTNTIKTNSYSYQLGDLDSLPVLS